MWLIKLQMLLMLIFTLELFIEISSAIKWIFYTGFLRHNLAVAGDQLPQPNQGSQAMPMSSLCFISCQCKSWMNEKHNFCSIEESMKGACAAMPPSDKIGSNFHYLRYSRYF